MGKPQGDPGVRADSRVTQERILDACVDLFTERGFSGTSMRAIAEAAGVNIAAANYHFGSKEGLLSTIVDHHREQIDARRADLLGALSALGEDEPDLPALIDVLVAPLAAKLDDASGRAYLRIQAQGLSNDKVRPATRNLIQRIGRHIAPLDGEEADGYRRRFAVLLLFHALADRAEAEEAGRVRRSDRAAFVASLGQSILGLFAAA